VGTWRRVGSCWSWRLRRRVGEPRSWTPLLADADMSRSPNPARPNDEERGSAAVSCWSPSVRTSSSVSFPLK
jgi:hypothetical protein